MKIKPKNLVKKDGDPAVLFNCDCGKEIIKLCCKLKEGYVVKCSCGGSLEMTDSSLCDFSKNIDIFKNNIKKLFD